MASKTINRQTATKGPEVWRWASPEQEEAWKYGPYPLCLSGGYGSGKTVVACRKILRLMDGFPGYRVVIARKRWTHLQKTTMATFFKVCKPEMYAEGRRSDSEKILRLNNGSELLWMHLEDGEEVANIIPGLEINALFIDQAEEVEEEIFDKISSRLGRWDRAEVPQEILDTQAKRGRPWKWYNQAGEVIPPAYAIIACNPDNEMHWIYRRFHPDSSEHWERKIPEYDNGTKTSPPKPTGNLLSYHDLGYKMITMASTTNKFLTKQNISALLVNDESFIKRYVRGEWGSPEGSIHVVHPSSLVPGTQELVDHLVKTCRLHRTMDYGDSAPTVVLWWAVDKEGNSICYREYYEPNRLISDHRVAIKELSKDIQGEAEHYTFNLADPSIFSKMPQAKGGRWCVADEYADTKSNPETAIFWQPADNNELGTRNRINEYLRIDPKRKNPFTQELGAPRLYFLTRTVDYPLGAFQSPKQLRGQRRLRLGTDLGKPIFSDERDDNIVDHAYDCLSGDTRIVTPDGEVPIKDAPEKGTVLTPNGWKPYTDCRKYREKSPVLMLHFLNGKKLTCTPDHLILTWRGWKEAGTLNQNTSAVRRQFLLDGVMQEELLSCAPYSMYDQDTYCLTVDDISHAFCVEGGIVVHNCVRYHIASRPPIAATSGVQLHPNSFSAVRARVLQFNKRYRRAS